MEGFKKEEDSLAERAIPIKEGRDYIAKIIITDYSNDIAGLMYFDNDLPGLRQYLEENHFPSFSEKHQASLTRNGLSRFPDLQERIKKIEAMTKRLCAAKDPVEFKRLANAVFQLLYPTAGPNRAYQGEEVSAAHVS